MLILVGLLAGAADPGTSTATISVTVHGAPAPTALRDPSATTTHIGAERLERARRTGEDLGSVLDGVAGVRALDFGGPLAERRIGIRGGSPAQTLVLIDDVALRMPFASGPDLNLFSPEEIESAELSRGGRGALYGEGALSGAVSLRSRALKREQAIALGYGSFGTTRVNGALALDPIAVSAGWEHTAGDFAYSSELLGLPDQDRVRLNNDAQRGRLGLRLGGELGGVKLELSSAGSYRDAGVPGLEATPAESLTARETQRFLFARGGARVAAANASLRAGASLNLLEIDYRDPSYDQASFTRFVSAGADVSLTLAASEQHKADVQLALASELADSTLYGTPTRPRVSGLVSDRWRLGPLAVFGALRLEAAGGQGLWALPRVGAALFPLDGLELRLGAGRSARMASLDELYHPLEVGYEGNPTLVPESAWELEAGAHVQLGPADLDLAAYGRRLEQAIVVLNRNAFVLRPENVGASWAYGAELELSWAWSSERTRLGSSLALSWLETRLDVTEDSVPGQPRFSGALDLSAGWGPLDLSSTLRGFSTTFTTLRPSEGNVVPGYLRWDACLSYAFVSFASAALLVQNLLDDRALMSVNRIPLPGRALLFTLRFATDALE